VDKIFIKKTYKDQVVDYVYQLLLSGELKPGEQIKESLLAEQMGISRAPIREAMKELIMNGLVDYRPQVGNFIPVLSAKEVIDSYSTRGVLEGYAIMETSGNFSGEELDRLDELTRKMENYANKKNHKMVVELGGEFHDLLISKCDNVQLLEYTDQTIEYLPFRAAADDKRVTVRTEIVQPGGHNIPLDYRMYLDSNGEWKVYDISVDGVSLVTNYRSSFATEINQGGIGKLLKKLAEMNRKGRQKGDE